MFDRMPFFRSHGETQTSSFDYKWLTFTLITDELVKLHQLGLILYFCFSVVTRK